MNKKILGQIFFFGKKNMLGKNKFGSKIFLWVKKNLTHRNFGGDKFLGKKKIWSKRSGSEFSGRSRVCVVGGVCVK